MSIPASPARPPLLHRSLHAVMRVYWRFARPLTMGVRGLVFDEEGRVMLVRHSYMRGWYLPGGGVERGETALDAVTRELDEEAGILLTEPPRLFGLYANFREFKSDHVALYVAGAGTYAREERRSLEISDYGFFSPDALPEETSPATAARIREVREGLTPPDMWAV
ncbi:NUDIX domain-containing protein [Tepidicaulis sp. LMO-SS28]|uniref:NUDIX domain-containing protein n=1 Tax=Tepidicaulis sp. LMO-SS28 TaxID=3447455 RepID=UPI003EE1C154